MQHKRVYLGIVVLMVMTLASGCITMPKKNMVEVSVEYGDTGLPMVATVRLGNKVFTTENGRYVVDLEPGIYEYTVTTMVGSANGTVPVQAKTPITLRVPVDETLFDLQQYRYLLHHLSFKDMTTMVTYRWPYGKQIRVWLGSHPSLTETDRQNFWDSLHEWAEVLDGIISFVPATSVDEADMEVRFGGEHTWCDLTQTDRKTGYLKWVGINIGDFHLHNPVVYKHEIGHCIGLNHGTDPTSIMTPGSSRRTGITESDRFYARLLYSVPPYTPMI